MWDDWRPVLLFSSEEAGSVMTSSPIARSVCNKLACLRRYCSCNFAKALHCDFYININDTTEA